MAAPFNFGQAFQEEMLALMLADAGFAHRAGQYVPEDRLYSEVHKWLFTFVKERVDTSNEVPSYSEIENEIIRKVDRSKRRMYKAFLDEVYTKPIPNPGYVKTMLTDYARRAFFLNVFSTGQTLWNSRKFDEAYISVQDGINELYGIDFSDEVSVSLSEFEDVRQQFVTDSTTTKRRLPTGIPGIDSVLQGGLAKGEMGIILAEAKRGKSISLIHMGAICLMMRMGRVVHFQLEGAADQTTMRYQARLSHVPYNRIRRDDLTDPEREALLKFPQRIGDNLEVIPLNSRWDYTVADLDARIVQMQRRGRAPDLVIVDYGDLLTTDKHREVRLKQMQVFRELKQLAMVRKVALWTASQSQRPSKEESGAPTVLRSKDIAEAYEKVRITDFLMTLNQTARERLMGVMRVHIDIYRDNEADKTIMPVVDFSRMVFHSAKYGCIDPSTVPRFGKR